MADDGIRIGSVSIDVVPDATRVVPTIRAQLLPEVDRLGRELGQRIAGPIASQVSDGIVRGIIDGGTKGRAGAAQAGNASGGAFADSFRARVTAALRDLPKPKVGVDATEADAELADIRARLQALSDVRVGVDIGAAEAIAELDDLKARLDELGARSPNIDVKVDAARASAELAAVQAEVAALDGEDAVVNIEADTSGAISGISGMEAVIAGLGPALIPIGAAATVGLAGIASAAASGAAGLGVLTLGFSAVSNAVSLLGKEHTAAAEQAARSAATQASSAASEVLAANQVRSATESLALARQQAASQEIAASEAVQRAQYARTQADQQEAAAQTQLNNAREQAARDLESAANRAVDAQLAAKQAAIDVTTAQANYNTTINSGTATALQKQQATLDLAKAQQALVEANEQAKQAEQDNTAAQKAGVSGSSAVVSATKAVADAKHNQQQAGQALTDAERAQALQQQQSAFAVEQAENAITAAQVAQAKASQGAGVAGVTALAQIQAELAKTNPAVLAFATFVTDTIEPAFARIKNAAAAGLLPGVEAGIKALAPLLKPFTVFVGDLAKTMGDLFSAAGKALTSPFWTNFFTYVAQTAGPTLATMGRVIGDVATGFAGLMQAFAPVVTQFGAGILRVAGSFADFGQHLGTNGPFQAFLAYVKREAPVVGDLIGKVFDVIGKLLPILAPFGDLVLKSLDVLAGVLAKMSPAEILALGGALAAAFGGPVVQVAAAAAAIAYVYDHSETFRKAVKTLAHDISAVVSPVLKEFRDHWGDIKDAISTVIDWIDTHVGPVLRALGDLFVAVVGTVRDLWDRFGQHLVDHLKTAFGAIAEILSGAFKILQGIFEIFTGILTGKWSKIWQGFKDILDGEWKIIQGVVRTAINVVSTIIGAGMAVVSEIWSKEWGLIKSAADGIWGGISDGVQSLWAGIKGLFVAGINDVIGLLDDFIGIINKLLHGVFHLPAIPTVPKIGGSSPTSGVVDHPSPGKPGLFAFGGVVPGYRPGVDIVPAMLSPGEAVLRPEVVRALGPATIHSWNSHAVHMKGGGILGDLTGALGTLGGLLGGAAKDVAGVALGPALSAAEAPIHAAIGLMPHGLFRDLANGVITDADHGIRDMLGISYDQGGLLQPGYTLAYNGTREPEAVMSAQTFAQVVTGASGGGRHMEVHELHVHQVAPAPLETSLPKAMRRLEFELSL